MFFCMLNTYALYGRKTLSVLCTKYFICIVFIPQIKYRKNCLLCYHDCMQNLWLICIKQTSFHGLKMWYSVPVYLSYANRYILYMENSSYWKIILMQWIFPVFIQYKEVPCWASEASKRGNGALLQHEARKRERERKLYYSEALLIWTPEELKGRHIRTKCRIAQTAQLTIIF